jgi:pre-rRNA-processing protein TSR4
MPQLLSYLGVDEDDPSAPDWGTIAVYSCAASCDPAGGGGGGGGGGEREGGGDSAYAEEFVWVQPPATA